MQHCNVLLLRPSPVAAPSTHVALARTEATTGESAPWMRERRTEAYFGFEVWELNMVFYGASATHRERAGEDSSELNTVIFF